MTGTGLAHKSVLRASGTMLGLSALLFWLPVLGPGIAGFAGGRKAGGVREALVAAVLPATAMWILTLLFGGVLASIPVVGWAFGMARWAVGTMNMIPLLVGAAIGGASN